MFAILPDKWRVVTSSYITVEDRSEGRTLTIHPEEKKASLRYLDPEDHGIDLVAKLMKTLKNTEHRRIGQKKIDAHEAEGFAVDFYSREARIWIDVRSELPIHIELDLQDGPDGSRGTLIMSKIELNRVLDRAIFSLTAPPGYDLEVDPLLSEGTDRLRESGKKATKIWQACFQYAAVHGKLPAAPAPLIHGNYFLPRRLIAPADAKKIPDAFKTWSKNRQTQWVNANSSYLIVPYPKFDGFDSSNMKNIGLLEMPGISDQHLTVVLLFDGTLKFLPINEVERLVEQHAGKTIQGLIADLKE